MILSRTVVDWIGWIAVTLLLGNFFALSFELITARHPVYQVLNTLGAAGIIYHSIKRKDYQPAVLNLIYALIALLGLARVVFFV